MLRPRWSPAVDRAARSRDLGRRTAVDCSDERSVEHRAAAPLAGSAAPARNRTGTSSRSGPIKPTPYGSATCSPPPRRSPIGGQRRLPRKRWRSGAVRRSRRRVEPAGPGRVGAHDRAVPERPRALLRSGPSGRPVRRSGRRIARAHRPIPAPGSTLLASPTRSPQRPARGSTHPLRGGPRSSSPTDFVDPARS